MSYLEIYNENIRDLLEPSSGYLELRDESGGRNIQVSIPFHSIPGLILREGFNKYSTVN